MPSPRQIARGVRALAFESVRRYHRALPAFTDLYAGGPHKLGPVFPKEAQLLFSLASLLMPRRIVEIGVGFGGSEVAFAEACRQNRHGRVVAVDQNEAAIRRAQRILTSHGLGSYISYVLGDSRHATTCDCVAQLTGQIDLLFIDGDHSFDGTVGDFETYRDLVAPNGLIAFHDTGSFAPSRGDVWRHVHEVTRDDDPIPNTDQSGLYHLPDVPRAVDWILSTYPEYSLLNLHTLAEPCCGISILQKTAKLFCPGR
jgi:predicted O-methyltransferase YrrM